MDERERDRKILEHLDAIRSLERQRERAPTEEPVETWPPDRFYTLWHVVVGATLGVVGAAASLLANALGAPVFGEDAMQLIRTYLTFPMGERALTADSGVVLTVGSLLYLVTGAAYGVAFHFLMRLVFPEASAAKRFGVSTAFGIAIWIVNYYLLLSWLQPLLLGGDWIVSTVPIWVAAATHLAFAWTMWIGETWGGVARPFRERFR